MKTKLIPFDINKAKAGAKIVTRDGYPVRIGFFDLKVKGLRSFPIVGAIDRDGKEDVRFFTAEGKFSSIFDEDGYDLFIEEVEELETREKNNDAICASADSHKCFKALQNTKPGEILASKDGADILIFKKVDNFEHFSSYYNIQGKPNYSWVNRQFIPATEEQRNRLLQEMEKEGYKWDQYKKELHKIEKKTRRMTNQELAWWLRDSPEEHREYRYKGGGKAHFEYLYELDETDKEADKDIRIRKNGDEWQEPIIEI